ncbi:transposase [Escherichia coli]|nr:transposase [Escherichia coli]
MKIRNTPVKVLAPGQKKAKTGRIWTYVRDDRNVGSSSPPAVWFAYSPNRQGKHPEQHLRPFRGILQADAFTGYDRLFSAEREGGALTEVACWAHARRKIHDVYISSKSATAEEALKRISELYAIEDEIRGLPESERLAVRQQRSKVLLTSLHECKRLARTVLIFTERSDQLSRATDRVPGLPASPGYAQ